MNGLRSLLFVTVAFFLVSTSPSLSSAQGLKGLGAPGALLGDPKAASLEAELLAEINGMRTRRELPHLAPDPRLRGFARQQAERAAKGLTSIDETQNLIEDQRLAPHGHYFQFSAGVSANAIVHQIRRSAQMRQTLRDSFARAGVGGYWVPAKPPFFQVAMVFAKDHDPRAGQPGLSRHQTDPVMHAALPAIKECFNQALKNNPRLGGDVTFELVIGKTGAVSQASLPQCLPSAVFESCALNVVQDLIFPAPYQGKPVTLQHPVRLSPPQTPVGGHLSASQIQTTLSKLRPAIKSCYDDRLEYKPDLAGSITLSLTVRSSGELGAVRVVSEDLGDPPLQRCVVKNARWLRFPRPQPEGEVQIVYPLTFSPPPQTP